MYKLSGKGLYENSSVGGFSFYFRLKILKFVKNLSIERKYYEKI